MINIEEFKEQLNLRLDRLEEYLKTNLREIKIQGKNIDILDADMEEFYVVSEKINRLYDRFASLEQSFRTLTQKQQSSSKNLQSELQEMKDTAENITDEVKDVVSDKVGEIIQTVRRKRVFIKTPSFFSKLFGKIFKR